MKTILMLLALSMIWRGSLTDEKDKISFSNIISWICAIAAWCIIMFGNVVE